MVRSKIEDKRNEKQKKIDPWWWRDISILGENVPFTSRQGLIAAYRYESGRRWLRRVNKKSWNNLPPYPVLLKPESHPQTGFALRLLLPLLLENLRFGAYANFNGKLLTKKQVSSYADKIQYEDGDWVILKNIAWNLNENWKFVAPLLKIEFERQKGLAKSKKSRPRLNAPAWLGLELWDLWESNIALTERYSDGSVGHQDKAKEVEKEAESFGLWLIKLLNSIESDNK